MAHGCTRDPLDHRETDEERPIRILSRAKMIDVIKKDVTGPTSHTRALALVPAASLASSFSRVC